MKAVRRFPHQVRTMITSHAVMVKQHGEPNEVLFTHKYDIDDDNLDPDSVIVRTVGASINPSDINQIQGVYPSQPEKTTKLGTDAPSFVGGNEGLFEIVKAGANVKDLSPSDWVVPIRVCLGTWRTYGEFKATDLFKIPNSTLSIPQASTLLVNPLSAYLMLTHFNKVSKGDWFIQNGGNSAVGKYASQIGRILGVNSISVVRDRPDLDALKEELAKLGATKVVTEEENNSREFSATIKEWTKGSSVNLALNCVGGKSSTGVARKLSPDGLMLTYGGMSFQPVILPTSLHIFKNITSAGFWCTRIVESDLDLKKEILNKIIAWYESGDLVEAPTKENAFEGGDLTELFVKGIADKSGKQIVVFK